MFTSAKDAEKQLKELAGSTVFRVVFVKRTTGELRTMLCRFGVKKGLSESGEGRKFEPTDRGLVGVWDMQKDGYRMISVEGIREVKIRGKVYRFKKEGAK